MDGGLKTSRSLECRFARGGSGELRDERRAVAYVRFVDVREEIRRSKAEVGSLRVADVRDGRFASRFGDVGAETLLCKVSNMEVESSVSRPCRSGGWKYRGTVSLRFSSPVKRARCAPHTRVRAKPRGRSLSRCNGRRRGWGGAAARKNDGFGSRNSRATESRALRGQERFEKNAPCHGEPLVEVFLEKCKRHVV